MLYTRKNSYGKIEFDKGIIASIIYEEISNWRGKVFLSNVKGRLLKSKYEDSLNVTYIDDRFEIELYLVFRFGLSIKKNTGELIQLIKNRVQEVTGIEVAKVTIVLTGVISQRISKRHIEVSG